MKLSNFEEYIEDIILERGFDYYSNDYITDIREIAKGHFVAEVEGSDYYTVEAVLGSEDEIIRLSCDCPYSYGPFCKHQAAVLYALRNSEKTLGPEASGHMEIKSGLRQDLTTILSNLPKEELIKIIRNHLHQYPELEQQLLFEYVAVEQEITAAKKLIKYHINKATHRGFIDWDKASDAMEGAWRVLDKADRNLEEGKVVNAVQLALTVLPLVVEVLEYCDDSDGSVGMVIEEGINTVNEFALVIAEKSPPAEQQQVFKLIFKEAMDRRYDEWFDWRLELLQACTVFCGSPELREQLEQILEKMAKKLAGHGHHRIYNIQRIKLLQFELIERFDTREKAEAFIKENISYSQFREKAIAGAMRKKQYEEAIRLCLAGEEADKGYFGLINKWREFRYLAHEKSGDMENQRKLAMEFALDGYFEYYLKLKQFYEPHEWQPVVESIIKRFLEMQYTPAAYTKILIEEGLTAKLLEYCRKNIREIENYCPHLLDEHFDEAEQLFTEYIQREAALSGKRSHYKQVCGKIRRYKKLFGEERAERMILELKNRYRRRPAFIDELSRI